MGGCFNWENACTEAYKYFHLECAGNYGEGHVCLVLHTCLFYNRLQFVCAQINKLWGRHNTPVSDAEILRLSNFFLFKMRAHDHITMAFFDEGLERSNNMSEIRFMQCSSLYWRKSGAVSRWRYPSKQSARLFAPTQAQAMMTQSTQNTCW